MRTIQVCALAFLLACAIHDVSAQVDEEYEGQGDEEGPEEILGMGHEDLEHAEDVELSLADVFHMHGEVDTDQSGMITREELLAYFHKAHKEGRLADETLEEMERIDGNQDGSVSLDELKEAYHPFKSENDPEVLAEEEHLLHGTKLKFANADADESGELNFDEFMSFHIPDERVHAIEAKLRLEEFDQNKDGQLSYHEFEEIVKDVEGDNTTSEAPTAFTFLDVDESGFISLEEYVPWELGHFDRDKAITRLLAAADRDGDKTLDVEELMAIEKDIIHHREEHAAILELVEFSKMEKNKETEEKAEVPHKDEL